MTYITEQRAATLQRQAADLSKIARQYAELGPSWRLQAETMQKLAKKHYSMARKLTTRSCALRRLARIVGRG